MSKNKTASLVARSWQIAAVGIVIAVFAGWLPIPRTLTVFMPQQHRWWAGVIGLGIGVGTHLLDRRFGLMRTLARLPPWGRVLSLLLVAILFFLIRPRLHWGDSASLIASLDAGIHRWNPRWLTAMIALSYAYDPLRPLISGTLFLTIVYIGLGCLGVLMMLATLRLVADGREVPITAVILMLASPATLLLMSGYLEIYAMVQFGIITFLWAAAAFSLRRPWMGFALFGLVSGIASMLYVGNLMLLPCGVALAVVRLLGEQSPERKALRSRALEFSVGALGGVYASVCLLTGELLPGLGRSVQAAAAILLGSGQVFRDEAAGVTWYSPVLEALSWSRVREWAEVWSLYGFFGLLFAVAVLSLAFVDTDLRRRLVGNPLGGFLPMLVGLIGLYLFVYFVKRRPMGWRDWDYFSYAVYPVNLLSAFLLTRLQGGSPRLLSLARTFTVCATVWAVMAYVYLNPIRPEWTAMPPRKRVLAFESYQPTLRLPASEAEARGIREVTPFP